MSFEMTINALQGGLSAPLQEYRLTEKMLEPQCVVSEKLQPQKESLYRSAVLMLNCEHKTK